MADREGGARPQGGGATASGASDRCDRCGASGGTLLFEALDPYSLAPSPILACEGCGVRRTLPGGPGAPAPYGPLYRGVCGERFLAPVERVEALFRRSRARWVRRLTPGPGRALDIGCGRGIMLAALQERGWECVGTEASPELARSVGRARGLTVLASPQGPLPFADAHFDLVTAWHSLEHLERPVHALREVRRLLRPGGMLVVEVPNGDSLQARWGGARWFHLDVPRHRYHFSRRHLREILSESGFEVERESTWSLEYGPFGMVQSLLNRATFAPDVLFRLVRRRGGRPPRRGRAGFLRGLWDLSATALLLLPLGVAGALAEVAACLAGRGGVVRAVARRGAG